jgi:hypothetical protein
MARFYWPLCIFNRHTPSRRLAKWDGFNYVSTCKICGKQVRRRDSGRWLKDWLEETDRP